MPHPPHTPDGAPPDPAETHRANLPLPPPEPVDPDLGPELAPGERPERQWPVLVAISLGGGLGAAIRYGAIVVWPTPAGAFPWTILAVNVAGCAAMGVLMALLTEGWPDAPRLARPFLGTGMLGGFTTFSAYALDVQTLYETGRHARALADLALSVVAALAGVTAGAWLTRRAVRRLGRAEEGPA
ncbi:fluoride efflux transporter FluC [Streptomyces koyangensis]|uniref:fluoride efflux transporter FluC n=1 Tax=Streptomyces koyangensis TaxID=188770 RepID=UPI003C3065B4